MLDGIKIVQSYIIAVFCTAIMFLLPTSCSINEGIRPCPQGLDLHFVFDYHLEGWSPDVNQNFSLQNFSNAFYPQVDCYVLYVYDENENLIATYSDLGKQVRSNHYHLTIDLPYGKYKIRAFGGAVCADKSFRPYRFSEGKLELLDVNVSHSLSDLYWQMGYNKKTMESDRLLHDFYYAYAIDSLPITETEVVVDGDMYKNHTLRFMRNTNAVHVAMQHLSKGVGSDKSLQDVYLPVYTEDYVIRITDNNTLFDHANRLVHTGETVRDEITYYPWTTKNVVMYQEKGTNNDASVATADISISRLMADTEGRIQILNRADGETLLDIPLSHLRLSKPAQFRKMCDQEYFDRQKFWNITFIRHSNELWSEATIIVNGWKVNLNEIDF